MSMIKYINYIAFALLFTAILTVRPLIAADSLPRVRSASLPTVEEVSPPPPQSQDFASASNVAPVSAQAENFSAVHEIIVQRMLAKDYPSVASLISAAIRAGDMKAANVMMDAVFEAGDMDAAEKVLSMVIQALMYVEVGTVKSATNTASSASMARSMPQVNPKAEFTEPAKTIAIQSLSRWDMIGQLPPHSKQWALQRIGKLRDARGQSSDDMWAKLLDSLQKDGN